MLRRGGWLRRELIKAEKIENIKIDPKKVEKMKAAGEGESEPEK